MLVSIKFQQTLLISSMCRMLALTVPNDVGNCEDTRPYVKSQALAIPHRPSCPANATTRQFDWLPVLLNGPTSLVPWSQGLWRATSHLYRAPGPFARCVASFAPRTYWACMTTGWVQIIIILVKRFRIRVMA